MILPVKGGLMLGALLALLGFTPLCAEIIALRSPPAHINDGDTFEADLNGNGRLEFPRERVRLLYVDTPELAKSHKGKDTRFGLPARAFLAASLKRLPIALWIDHARPRDKYGRTLALVHAGQTVINLRLIRLGHSYFDTRFGFPPGYARYAKAEAEAYQERLGIWSSPASRAAYLKRLRKEGKTPADPGNPLFLPGVHPTSAVDLTAHEKRFLRLRGKLLKRRSLRGGAWLLTFAGIRPDAPLQVYVAARVNRNVGVQSWPDGASVIMDGFAQLYRGRPQLRLHFGRVRKQAAATD